MGAAANTASAVTVGSFTFDTTAFADQAFEAQSSIADPGFAVDQDFGTRIGLDADDIARFVFTNNSIFNGPGFDLLVFELGDSPEILEIALNLAGPYISGTELETGIPNGSEPNIRVIGYDLGGLGVASNGLVNTIFMNRGSTTPNVAEVAASNSVNAPATLGMIAGAAALGIGYRIRRSS